jgi:surfactin synthase thioesterase subunit
LSHTTLVCLPFAGSGASFFRPWRKLAPEGLQITAPQLPGREWRLDEDPLTDVSAAVAALLPDVVAAGTGQRVALFGHSLGAVLAFELARRLGAVDGIELVHLFPSGSPDPWTRRARRAGGLDDDCFLRRVEEFAGYSHEALEIPEMLEVLLPAMRADVEMQESYLAEHTEPLSVPITGLRVRVVGLVSPDEAAGWGRATTKDFTLTTVDGGHMYLTDTAGPLLALIERAVAPT